MPNRYICNVLEEMRACYKTRNFASLLGLIEEAQTLANRMEAGLEDKRDVAFYREKRSELRDEIRELEEKKAELQKECGEKPTSSAQRRYI